MDSLQAIFDSSEPHHEPLPGKYNEEMDDFQKIIVLKCLRPDKITNAFQDYVAKHLGQRFIEPQVNILHLTHSVIIYNELRRHRFCMGHANSEQEPLKY